MTIRQRALYLQPRSESSNPYYPIDHFFSSLAEDQGANAIGIVLSGNGSDGAQGLRAIKSACGITFCQDEQSAKFGGMPHSAILTGEVDWVLSPAGIARELAKIKSHTITASPVPLADSSPNPAESENELRRIIGLLKSATNVDFGQYKQSTILRRIARRMMVHDLKSLGGYAEFLETHANEVAVLYRDLLINFTSFFREPEMFAVLGNALARLLEERSAKAPFRIWVAGCATGEEAYSIAITAFEVLDRVGKELPIQVFATDLSETAIERARTGTYPASIEGDVSPRASEQVFLTRGLGLPRKTECKGKLRLRQARPDNRSTFLPNGSGELPECPHLSSLSGTATRDTGTALRS